MAGNGRDQFGPMGGAHLRDWPSFAIHRRGLSCHKGYSAAKTCNLTMPSSAKPTSSINPQTGYYKHTVECTFHQSVLGRTLLHCCWAEDKLLARNCDLRNSGRKLCILIGASRVVCLVSSAAPSMTVMPSTYYYVKCIIWLHNLLSPLLYLQFQNHVIKSCCCGLSKLCGISQMFSIGTGAPS